MSEVLCNRLHDTHITLACHLGKALNFRIFRKEMRKIRPLHAYSPSEWTLRSGRRSHKTHARQPTFHKIAIVFMPNQQKLTARA
ncbi:MAG: hypothetical protein EBX16_04665, partial [Burkholderiaceae bacterium]|nr:hypothetical protein [Burkholderiaceae bacterium]